MCNKFNYKTQTLSFTICCSRETTSSVCNM